MKLEMLGLKINTERKAAILELIRKRIKNNQKTFIVTPYSEFFYYSFTDQEFRQIINEADIAIPDGIMVLWLPYFLSIPFKTKYYYLKMLEGIWQIFYTGLEILFRPQKLRRIVPEKFPGSDFFWDLISVAETEKLKVFLLGGWKDTAEVVIEKVRVRHPEVEFAGFDNAHYKELLADPNKNQELIRKINESGADLLMVAFGPVRQEKWLKRNSDSLHYKIAIGVGGTFDYIAGRKKNPPKFVREIGLEWFYRLITQPYRARRIWNATYGLYRAALRHKVFMSQPFRPNVVGVIINAENKILAARRIVIEKWRQLPPHEAHWQLPQGGIDRGEEPEHAVLREMREEVGLEELKVLGRAPETYSYLWPNCLRRLIFNPLKYKGQEQIIFYLRYEGIKNPNIDNKEFGDFLWLTQEELKSKVHPIRQNMLEIVLKHLNQYLN
jgi:N-acetylglucosaminyldiphosphoundecaprenol N-acetyl-beta-D-mannosaminyltransferase